MNGVGGSRRSVEYTADGVWRLHHGVIRRFIDTEPDYTALCREVAYILTKRTEAVLAHPATVLWRSKSLNSFLEKIRRKQYLDPLSDIKDRAGVRVVCDYDSDCEDVAEIITSEFQVIESQDRTSELGVDKFGYSARHYLVHLGPQSVGARYDDLRPLPCEIQVRTVLQDAWAVLQHHLFYKDEGRTPSELLRGANSLAALLENADRQFEQLRRQRDEYVEQLRESRADRERFLLNELTLESFVQYLQWKFPGRPVQQSDGQARRVLADLDRNRFRLLSDIDNAIERNAVEIAKVSRAVDPVDLTDSGPRPSVYDAVWAAALEDPGMLSGTGLPSHWREALKKARMEATGLS